MGEGTAKETEGDFCDGNTPHYDDRGFTVLNTFVKIHWIVKLKLVKLIEFKSYYK